MGIRVHVVSRHAEYANAEAFNYGAGDFKDLLNEAGGNVCSKDYDEEDYECRIEDYKTAVKVIACLAKRDPNDPYRVALFDEAGTTTEDLEAIVGELADGKDKQEAAKYVLDCMVMFLVNRDRNSDWITFSAF